VVGFSRGGGVRNRAEGRALLRPRQGGIFTVTLPRRSTRARPIVVRGLWRRAGPEIWRRCESGLAVALTFVGSGLRA
jgi:hypothetical protein